MERKFRRNIKGVDTDCLSHTNVTGLLSFTASPLSSSTALSAFTSSDVCVAPLSDDALGTHRELKPHSIGEGKLLLRDWGQDQGANGRWLVVLEAYS